ncbi:MAG: hypothetical protein AABZ62_06555, partial [Planctomycetota bacterium]
MGIETLDGARETVKESIDYANTLSGCKYADIRLGLAECKSASSENGTPKGMEEEVKISFGVRLVAGDPPAGEVSPTADMPAWGYYGQPLGKA